LEDKRDGSEEEGAKSELRGAKVEMDGLFTEGNEENEDVQLSSEF
jgi:hypothetical protein